MTWPAYGIGLLLPPPATCHGVPCQRIYLRLAVRPYDADAARVRRQTRTEVTRTTGPHYEVVVSVASGQVLTTAG